MTAPPVEGEPPSGSTRVVDEAFGSRVALLRLLQLSSPTLPIGAFAYSTGLEQAVERGWVTCPTDLQDWLEGVLSHSLGRTDLPLLALAIRHWQHAGATFTPPAEQSPEIRALANRVIALRETRELRAEEHHLGSSLARVLVRLGLREAGAFVSHPSASYVVLFGLAAARWGITEDDALCGFGFAWLENQLGAASRLFALGQLDAQAILARLTTLLPPLSDRARSLPDDQIGYSLPALALASSWHEEQYSRLFRS